MKRLALVLLMFALCATARADSVTYQFTSNEPSSAGDLKSFSLTTDGFITSFTVESLAQLDSYSCHPGCAIAGIFFDPNEFTSPRADRITVGNLDFYFSAGDLEAFGKYSSIAVCCGPGGEIFNHAHLTVSDPAPVPEPGTLLLLGTGLVGIFRRNLWAVSLAERAYQSLSLITGLKLRVAGYTARLRC